MGKNETEFIEKMATAIGDLAKNANLLKSVFIAQAILETGWGGSELFTRYNNAYGLNWYKDKVCEPYQHVDKSVPQENANGEWVYKVESMCKFDSITMSTECLVRWYSMRTKYKPIIGQFDYKVVCNFLTGKYATDSRYGTKLIDIIEKYDLSKYDEIEQTSKTEYFVQSGAFIDYGNAQRTKAKLVASGFDTLIKYHAPFYRLQTGAYSIKQNATKQLNALKSKGFNAFITSEIVGTIIN